MILVVDNYDSFTYNLVQEIGSQGRDVEVRRNDRFTLDEVAALAPSHIVVSPGPGQPRDAGLSIEIIRRFHGQIPILGVCLGHQALAVAAGGRVGPAQNLMHGKTSNVYHDGRDLFRGLPNPFRAGRYHSLVVPHDELPEGLEVSAHTPDGEIMGLRWLGGPSFGVQFHPESVLTGDGPALLRNFLEVSRES